MQKRFFITLLIISLTNLFAQTGSCQEMLDVQVEPKPFNYIKSYDFTPDKPVKSITYLSKKYRKNNLISTDTIYKELLTKSGKRLSFISYRDNKSSFVSDYEYFPDKNVVKWTTKDPKQKNNISATIITKNKMGNDVLHYSPSILNGDTTTRTYKRFFYNSKNLLAKTTYGHTFKGSQYGNSTTTYEYLGEDMVLSKYFSDLSRPNFYQATAYTYDKSHLPIAKKTYQVRNGVADTPALHTYYTYQNGLLIHERYERYNDKAKITETTVDYTYNANKQLIKLYTKADTSFREIGYEYENHKIKKVTINTNTEFLSREELILVDGAIKKPFRYEKLFKYDDFGNLITTKEFVNGELQKELIKDLVYY